MDESWRMRMGQNLPRRRSTEDTSSDCMRKSCFDLNNSSESGTLDPSDFSDVFGGPPRSIFSRQFSRDFTNGNRSSSFYEEIFRSPHFTAPVSDGRNLPAFRVPAKRSGGSGGVFRRNEGFYSDIFGADEDRRSRSRSKSKPNSKSKSKSSSVLSSEEMSPLRSSVAEDVVFSSFASKLRPIIVPCGWNSTSMMPEEQQKRRGMSAVPCSGSFNVELQFMKKDFNENFTSSHFGFSRRVPSPETISLEPNSYRSIKISVDDLETDSPTSVVSSLCRDAEAKVRMHDKVSQEQEVKEEEEDEEEIMSSYVIEINSDQREGMDDTLAIEEAIAWAKEKFQTQSSEDLENLRQHQREPFPEREERPITLECLDQQTNGHGIMQFLEANKEPRKGQLEEEKQRSDKDMEMEQLEEDIKSWSAGKEVNIRLLLSTLHHVLWPNSGWYAIPLTNLIENSQVKKAYQKARLCLHPDKLQQRGAIPPQKYVAEKAFTILQDAWAAFISQDVFFS